jgi:phosphate transport system protein
MRQLALGIDELKRKLSQMGSLVENAIGIGLRTLEFSGAGTASLDEAIESEKAINRLEMEIDDGAIRLLALHQPVACDLRFLTSALKMTTDLERMGDLAVNIARRLAVLSQITALSQINGNTECLEEIRDMAAYVGTMVAHATEAFERGDSGMASKVLREDDVADRFLASVTRNLFAAITGDPAFAETAFELMFVARHLERIADHATNIAEDVLYLLSGVDVRHHMSLSQVA